MTDREEATHNASNCDAFPLAVGLAQVQARLAAAEADAARLAEALESAVETFAQDPDHADSDGCIACDEAREALAAHAIRLIDG